MTNSVPPANCSLGLEHAAMFVDDRGVDDGEPLAGARRAVLMAKNGSKIRG